MEKRHEKYDDEALIFDSKRLCLSHLRWKALFYNTLTVLYNVLQIRIFMLDSYFSVSVLAGLWWGEVFQDFWNHVMFSQLELAKHFLQFAYCKCLSKT